MALCLNRVKRANEVDFRRESQGQLAAPARRRRESLCTGQIAADSHVRQSPSNQAVCSIFGANSDAFCFCDKTCSA